MTKHDISLEWLAGFEEHNTYSREYHVQAKRISAYIETHPEVVEKLLAKGGVE